MHADLQGLIRLQQVETGLRRIEGGLAELPRERAALETRLAEDKARLDSVRSALEASVKAQRQLEVAVQDAKARLSKYKGQLMEVKTNKEYTAMLHEIEAVEREIRGTEDRILGEMEKAESLQAEVRKEESLFKQAETRHRGEVQALEERARALEADASRLSVERDEVSRTLSEGAFELFRRVARLRGVAVAEARDGMCQLCRVKLRPQMFVDLKRNEGIIQCPSCSRILFYEAPAPAATPGP